jgi:hypothetical protein
LVAFDTREAAVKNEEKKAKAAKRARYGTKVAALVKKQSVQGDAGLFGYESISDGEAFLGPGGSSKVITWHPRNHTLLGSGGLKRGVA